MKPFLDTYMPWYEMITRDSFCLFTRVFTKDWSGVVIALVRVNPRFQVRLLCGYIAVFTLYNGHIIQPNTIDEYEHIGVS